MGSSNPEAHRFEQTDATVRDWERQCRGCEVARSGFEVLYQAGTGCGCVSDVCLLTLSHFSRAVFQRKSLGEPVSRQSVAFFLQECASPQRETAIVARVARPTGCQIAVANDGSPTGKAVSCVHLRLIWSSREIGSGLGGVTLANHPNRLASDRGIIYC